MKRSKRLRRVKVSADGAGVVSHAGMGLLREMAEETGLVREVTGVLLDTYDGVPGHAPGRVFADLAVAIADGADSISGIAVLRDRAELFGAVASLPEYARPRPSAPDSPRLLARSDSAGATHTFAQACRDRGVGFSFGFPVDTRIQAIVDEIPEERWYPAIESDGGIRDGAWVTDATGLIDLSAWPEGSALILRAERPHLGAQLRFTDADGHRVTAVLTDTPSGALPGQVAGFELRHRQPTRVEDRIREGKATGLRNLPCRGFAENAAWLEAVLTTADLVCCTQLLGFHDTPDLARCEIATFRYRVLHVAARITRGVRQTRLRIDKTWLRPVERRQDTVVVTDRMAANGGAWPTLRNGIPVRSDKAWIFDSGCRG